MCSRKQTPVCMKDCMRSAYELRSVLWPPPSAAQALHQMNQSCSVVAALCRPFLEGTRAVSIGIIVSCLWGTAQCLTIGTSAEPASRTASKIADPTRAAVMTLSP